MNYFYFHLGDYAKATKHLSASEDAIYLRLLLWYYTKEKPLPAAVEDVARIARPDREIDVTYVLNEFFTLREDGWHQSRADREIAAYHEGADRARVNGRKGGQAKARLTRALANQEPRTKNQ